MDYDNVHNVSPIRPGLQGRGLALEEFDGPLSGPIWKRARAIRSSYPDTFDYSVYDELHSKFKGKDPRGGILFKSPFKLVNHHFSCSKCHYSFEIDTYGRGCTHNCVFCYAKESLTRHGYWNRPQPMPVDISEVRKVFHKVFETDKPSKWRSPLEKRIPIRIGSMSDAFMWMDRKFKVTQELLKILSFYKYPYIIFTRSDLIARDDYMSLLNPDLAAVQFSICGDDEKITRALEPGSPSVARRLSALKTLVEHGIYTGVRINPLFPTYPDGFFSDRESFNSRFSGETPRFPFLDISACDEFLARIAETGTPTVLAGFVRLSRFAISAIEQQLNIPLGTFFRTDIKQDANDKRYSDGEIAHYYKKIYLACKKANLRFSTCYIGNGLKDYYKYQDLWSNRSDCCDVRGRIDSFKTSCQEIGWDVREKHAPCKVQTEINKNEEAKWDAKTIHPDSFLRSPVTLVPAPPV